MFEWLRGQKGPQKKQFTYKRQKTYSLDIEECTACRNCVDVCPSQAIRIETFSIEGNISPVTPRGRQRVDGLDRFWLDFGKCTNCDLCVSVCEPHALSVAAGETKAQPLREDLIQDLTRRRLRRNHV